MILQKTDPSKGDGLFRRSLVNDLSWSTSGRQIQIMQPSDWLGINTASRMRSTDRGLRKGQLGVFQGSGGADGIRCLGSATLEGNTGHIWRANSRGSVDKVLVQFPVLGCG